MQFSILNKPNQVIFLFYRVREQVLWDVPEISRGVLDQEEVTRDSFLESVDIDN